MGQALSHHLFPVVTNPHGTVFNPVSILSTLQGALSDGLDHLAPFMVERDGLVFNYKYHSTIHGTNHTAYEALLRAKNQELKLAIGQSEVIAITYGSAWLHLLSSNGAVVANCHKMPGHVFEKSLLGLDETIAAMQHTVDLIAQANPNAHILLTVSPVRHLSYGFANNHLGKAILLLAVDRVVKANANVHYFPAYELLMDDLRDYRFYAQDLVHPNELAIQYIWEKFGDASFNSKTKKANALIEKLQAAKHHRPIAQSSVGAAKWREHYLGLCLDIESLTGIDMAPHRNICEVGIA
jgi:hypothetical protein